MSYISPPNPHPIAHPSPALWTAGQHQARQPCALQRAIASLRHGQVSTPRGRPHNGLVAAADCVDALAVREPVERHVQDTQDRRKVGFVRHLLIRQVEAAFAEEAAINLLRGAREMEFVIQPDALVSWAQVPEAW